MYVSEAKHMMIYASNLQAMARKAAIERAEQATSSAQTTSLQRSGSATSTQVCVYVRVYMCACMCVCVCAHARMFCVFICTSAHECTLFMRFLLCYLSQLSEQKLKGLRATTNSNAKRNNK
jgi:hypothetical protein